VITSVKKLLGENEVNLGRWVKVSTDEAEAIQESLSATNYERGASNKPSLRLYSRDGYVVVCTRDIQAETYPEDMQQV